MKKLFLLFFAVISFAAADFENAKTSQACKKILDRGDFLNHIDHFVFYADNDNKTKRFLSVFFGQNGYVLASEKLPINANESEYIERGGNFTIQNLQTGIDMKEDEAHFVTMFLMDNTPYMCYFSEDERYIFEYDKKTNTFKKACKIERVGKYDYK
ncbi:MAG: hypothetical protein LBB59_07910 [Campylobacteraceae bacterium]|jgi:hypothetical protein|nr:hypothetical protein [Campylobacteraceae bacterium]